MIFDAAAYTTIPHVTAAETIALVHSLITSGKDVARHIKVKPVLHVVRDAGEQLQAEYFTPAMAPPRGSRVADLRIDRAWGAVDARIVTAYELDEETANAARALRHVLFPEGLTFLKSRYPVQWAEGQAIFARIHKGGHGPLLERLVGREYVDLVTLRQQEYGDAIGVTAPVVDAPVNALAESLRATREAIARYARVLSAFVDIGEVTEAHAASALRPLDETREGVRNRRSAAEAEADVEKLKAPFPALA